jgi:hypothetical protein
MGAQWLNPTGRVVLIKAILSTLPLYQCSAALAPQRVLNQISMQIRKFLWHGGKSNEKKSTLVKWNVVRNPRDRGDLEMRYPTLMNLAMGVKLLWRMISEK